MSSRRIREYFRLWTMKTGLNKLSQIMKGSSKILIAIIAVVILAGTAFLIVPAVSEFVTSKRGINTLQG